MWFLIAVLFGGQLKRLNKMAPAILLRISRHLLDQDSNESELKNNCSLSSYPEQLRVHTTPYTK